MSKTSIRIFAGEKATPETAGDGVLVGVDNGRMLAVIHWSPQDKPRQTVLITTDDPELFRALGKFFTKSADDFQAGLAGGMHLTLQNMRATEVKVH